MQFIPFVFIILFCITNTILAQSPEVKVELDTAEVPHLHQWGEQAQELILKWHPRLSNLLPTKGFEPPRSIVLKIENTERGIAATTGAKITVSSHWIEKHPQDFGLVLHELVHVIQTYPSVDPWGLTEGIADYLRWGIHEGQAQAKFPIPQEAGGYRKGYQAAAGFLLWIESDIDPGLVKKLNTAMRKGKYQESIFEAESGKTLDELWKGYRNSRTDINMIDSEM
ncbi:MAG TPA: hypothetical protein DD473_27125 [Planctomycetaceae bacterium]|nr:hypothetical protein [Planctomycetaceae bacterium]